MTDTIPEWALHEAAQIWCEKNHAAKQMDAAMVDSIARALASTAARVERETRDRALRAVLDLDHTIEWPVGAFTVVRTEVAPAIAALPLKYGSAS